MNTEHHHIDEFELAVLREYYEASEGYYTALYSGSMPTEVGDRFAAAREVIRASKREMSKYDSMRQATTLAGSQRIDRVYRLSALVAAFCEAHERLCICRRNAQEVEMDDAAYQATVELITPAARVELAAWAALQEHINQA